MNHFPKKSFRFAFGPPALLPARPESRRDVIWGRTVFHAPAFNPRTALDPLPFTVTRATQPPAERAR